MKTTIRKFQDNQIVEAGPLKLRLIIISAEECIGGWRYRLGFPTKSNQVHKNRNHRFFFEQFINPIL